MKKLIVALMTVLTLFLSFTIFSCGGGGGGGGDRSVTRGWGTAELIENNGHDAWEYQIACDGSGNAIAVWQQADVSLNNLTVWANRFDGINWGTAEMIENSGYNAYSPQIAFDGSGNVSGGV